RHAAAWWKRRGRPGGIVNTTPAPGIPRNQGQAHYGAAKGGVAAFPLPPPPGGRPATTEGPLGQLDFEGSFDPPDPANVAPVVVWLLSDAAAEVSGQVVGITRGLVELEEGRHGGPRQGGP